MAGLLRRVGAVISAAGIAAGASACFAAAGADVIKSRIDHMKGLGGAAKALGEQLRSGSPDPAVVKAEARKIGSAAQAMPAWFPRGSGPAAGVKTRALPAIWTDTAGFAAAQKAFSAEATRLNATAVTGDMGATGAQMGRVVGACKSCHDKFRGPEA